MTVKICRNGVTRLVILIGDYAIKLPKFANGYALGLRGLLSNLQERQFSVMASDMRLCPVKFSLWGGWLNIMPRCRPLTDFEWSIVSHGKDDFGQGSWNGFTADWKRDNFGVLKGQIVLLDYGEFT